jgi:hypothetical protein
MRNELATRIFSAVVPDGEPWVNALFIDDEYSRGTFIHIVVANLIGHPNTPNKLGLFELVDGSAEHFATVRFGDDGKVTIER